jgi:hypothetical protein
LGYVQKIKPQPVLAAKVVLFLCFVQQLPQSMVLAAIFSLQREKKTDIPTSCGCSLERRQHLTPSNK